MSLDQDKLVQYTQQALATYTAEAYQRGRIDEGKAQKHKADGWKSWFFAALAVLIGHVLFRWSC